MIRKIETREDIESYLDENLEFLKKNFNISKIGLFGSFSRDEADENSDIDLIVEFEGEVDIFETKEQLREFFRESLGREVDIVRQKYLKPRAKERIMEEAVYV
ncbi:MAG: nucleotidyltransferase family protein [bacterium]